MFVILTYDINQKRVGKAVKICRKYLHHVQKSVFEGAITEAKLEKLKEELVKIIHPEEDAICIYRMDSTRYAVKEQIGIQAEFSNII
jgi:CRISPR-associated protein Cas2